MTRPGSQPSKRAFAFLRTNARPQKPCTRGITEIRVAITPRWASAICRTCWRPRGHTWTRSSLLVALSALCHRTRLRGLSTSAIRV